MVPTTVMQKKPYPLAAARTQREQDKAHAQVALAARQAELVQAQSVVTQVEAAFAAQKELRDRRASSHTGAELARAGAHARHLAAQARELEAARQVARRRLAQAERALRRSELVLTAALVDHEVIDRHHASFDATQRKAAEREAEDEVEDHFGSRRKA